MSDGYPVASYEYDAWGKLLSCTGSMATTLGAQNPLRYRGYIFDSETELYYLQSRYYDPALRRFLNADAYISTGQGILGSNIFAYCGNNPIMRIDTTGYSFRDIIKGVWDWLVETYERNQSINQQNLELDTQIRLEQIEMVDNAVETLWDAYIRGLNHREEAQRINGTAFIEGMKVFFRNPEEGIDSILAVGSFNGAAYNVAVAAVTGNSVTGGMVAVGLALWGVYRSVKGLLEIN